MLDSIESWPVEEEGPRGHIPEDLGCSRHIAGEDNLAVVAGSRRSYGDEVSHCVLVEVAQWYIVFKAKARRRREEAAFHSRIHTLT